MNKYSCEILILALHFPIVLPTPTSLSYNLHTPPPFSRQPHPVDSLHLCHLDRHNNIDIANICNLCARTVCSLFHSHSILSPIWFSHTQPTWFPHNIIPKIMAMQNISQEY